MYKNIEELIAGHAIASSRLAFFEEWAPDDIYPCICAFATDAYFTGGGHIVIGVKTEGGIVKRPVKGIKQRGIQGIQKEMEHLDEKIKPVYHAQSFVEQADDKLLLVLYCPTGTGRPYQVPKKITDKESEAAYIIRENDETLAVSQERVYGLLNRFYRRTGGGTVIGTIVVKDHGVTEINVGGVVNYYQDRGIWEDIFATVKKQVKTTKKNKK